MAEPTRQRCTVTGCNPHLTDQNAASAHRDQAGHRTEAWLVGSAAGHDSLDQDCRSLSEDGLGRN